MDKTELYVDVFDAIESLLGIDSRYEFGFESLEEKQDAIVNTATLERLKKEHPKHQIVRTYDGPYLIWWTVRL